MGIINLGASINCFEADLRNIYYKIYVCTVGLHAFANLWTFFHFIIKIKVFFYLYFSLFTNSILNGVIVLYFYIIISWGWVVIERTTNIRWHFWVSWEDPDLVYSQVGQDIDKVIKLKKWKKKCKNWQMKNCQKLQIFFSFLIQFHRMCNSK